MAYNLINNGIYYFLSRPRRFGKSLLLDTLADIFLGKKELFKGLYIYDKWDWGEEYPVIRIDFSKGDFENEYGVKHRIFGILEVNGEILDIECD